LEYLPSQQPSQHEQMKRQRAVSEPAGLPATVVSASRSGKPCQKL
jgi:hypothetical protein